MTELLVHPPKHLAVRAGLDAHIMLRRKLAPVVNLPITDPCTVLLRHGLHGELIQTIDGEAGKPEGPVALECPHPRSLGPPCVQRLHGTQQRIPAPFRHTARIKKDATHFL